MLYRELGKTGYKASLLGMGCMRLPYIDSSDMTKGVDREKAYEMIQYAVDHGINYFDSAQGYHNGDSEAVLGEALDNAKIRDKVWITTKHPFWAKSEPDQIRKNLESTLKKLRTDHLDTLLMHGIGPGNWNDILEWDIWSIFEKFKSEGLINHIGFSYHGNYDHFKEVVNHYPWELCLVMHNLLDVDREVTAKGIQLASDLGVAVTIMEPLRGGGLSNAPKVVAEVYDGYSVKRCPSEWAFRYLANMQGVNSIVSGMSNIDQLKENLAIFSGDDLIPGCVSQAEHDIINAARKAYQSIVTIPCTTCNYCLPCPQGVAIPTAFSLYNDGNRFEFYDQVRRSYMFNRRGGRGAEKCNECGECIKKCPQNINIPEQLKVAHEMLKNWEE